MQRKSRKIIRSPGKRRAWSKRRIDPKLYSPKEKLHNCIWIFKIGDADDNPSVPHAHAQEYGYRLNAWSGEVYPAGTEREKVIGNLSRKELAKLHKDPDFLKFAKKQIEWYQEKFPHISFFVPEWFRIKYMVMKVDSIHKQDDTEKYIFIGKASIKQ